MAKYEIRQFTRERLEEVRQRWRGIAGDDEFDIEFMSLFEWCETHIEPSEGDSQAWELYNTDTSGCDAIIDMVDSKKGTLSKLLKLFLSPVFWDVESKRDQVISLYIDAFVEVIKNGAIKGAQDVKLYGRNDLMLSLLRSIHAHWHVPGTTASFQGRFLTISLA